MTDKLQNEIVSLLKSKFDISQIILFGSAALGTAGRDSDLDLIVILNESGFARSFREKINRRKHVSGCLYDIRKRSPLDILVYTRDEWDKLKSFDSSFMREIMERGQILA